MIFTKLSKLSSWIQSIFSSNKKIEEKWDHTIAYTFKELINKQLELKAQGYIIEKVERDNFKAQYIIFYYEEIRR